MKIPYAMVAAVENQKRHAQMAVAVHYANERHIPRLQQQPIDDSKILTLACYGPSLADTWQDMKPPILSMSGATQFLAERGVIADWHCEMDPRADKVPYFDPPVPGVHYLIASVCHPDVWPKLQGHKVTLWHTYSGPETYDWVASNDKDEFVIRGGCTIGLTALHLGGFLGFRHFEIHGMDGSFKDLSRGQRHAGTHHGHKQNKDGITWDAQGKRYATSKIMANAVAETLNTVSSYPIFSVFHGEGLTQALIKEHNFRNACCADETEKAEKLRKSKANIFDMCLATKDKLPTTSSWDVLCGNQQPSWFHEMLDIRTRNEKRRARANYNTGTITTEQMLQLRGLCEKYKPKVIVEIGTFIGNSALAMKAEKIYTCDRDNDCFEATDSIVTFPRQTSTEMLGRLVDQGVKADLFFFDGRIAAPDIALIFRLSHPDTIYIFDDYRPDQKGIVNVKRLTPFLGKERMIVEPDHRLEGKSTLAAIVPQTLFQTNIAVHGDAGELHTLLKSHETRGNIKVFIGYDHRQPVSFQVAAHSIWKRASRPVEIVRLDLSKLPMKRRGLTEFTFSRFLVPYLCDYQGQSIFMDSDVLCLGDVAELLPLANGPVSVVKNERRFEWASLMVFDNEKCKNLTPEFVDDPENNLFNLKWAESLDELPLEWNILVGYSKPVENPKLIHYTQGIPVWKETLNCDYSAEWHAELKDMASTCSFDELMGQSVHVKHMYPKDWKDFLVSVR